MKGEIKLKSTYGQGTSVNFIIPFAKRKSSKTLHQPRLHTERNDDTLKISYNISEHVMLTEEFYEEKCESKGESYQSRRL